MSYPLIEPEKILEILNTIEESNEQYKNLTFSTRQYFFADSLTPMNNGYASIGNKFAWKTFNCKNIPGYYISMDANNFREINNTYNHDVGDEVIKLISYSLRKATIRLGELGFTKLFRTGGDEFVFFTKSVKEVDIFITKACEFIDEIEPFPTGNVIKITLKQKMLLD